MKPLTVRLNKGSELQLQSVGWKSPSGDDCRRHFFALGDEGKVFILTPKPAMPEYYVPVRRAKAVLRGEPFPEAVCIEIAPCRLLPPPCYESHEAFESQLPAHYDFEPWRSIYWETHRENLVLGPTDEGPLREFFDQWLRTMRADYEHEVAPLQAHIEQLKTAPLAELGLDTDEEREGEIGKSQDQMDILQSNTPIQGVPCRGWLNLTFEDVKRGCEGIRDAWMHEKWARQAGEDLVEMSRERRKFRRWLEKHTGIPANVFHLERKKLETEIAPPSFGERFESDPRFLEACAQVRYRARFADNANTIVYLEDCEIREELTADEREEAAQLTKTQKSPEPTNCYSEGFSTVRRLNGNGEVLEILPLSNEFRALCQLLSECPDNIAQFSEIEPKIGTRAYELDIAAGVTNPAQKGERRIRDLLDTETGHKLVQWGVLQTIKVGREKFLKLSQLKSA